MQQKIVLKSFPGANTEDMWEYIKPTIKRKPDNVILHVGTNDLKKDVTVEEVAENIIKLATSSFLSGTKIAISGLVPRNDNLSERCDYLNDYLHKACAERNIAFINHYHCMDRYRHLNKSKLHLNEEGTVMLANSFLTFISKF